MLRDVVSRPRAVLLGGVLSILAAPAAAATCEDRVAALEEEHDLAATPPLPAPQTGSTGPTADAAGAGGSAPLAESGGVIAPPPTGDQAAIAPPDIGDAMPTAPEIEPEPGPPAGDADTAGAAEQAQVEALLGAARAAARQGDEQHCLERLEEAAALLADGG